MSPSILYFVCSIFTSPSDPFQFSVCFFQGQRQLGVYVLSIVTASVMNNNWISETSSSYLSHEDPAINCTGPVDRILVNV